MVISFRKFAKKTLCEKKTPISFLKTRKTGISEKKTSNSFRKNLKRQKQEKSGLNSFHKNSIWQKTGKSTPSRKNEDQSQNRQKHSKPICGTRSKNCGKSRLNKLLTHNLSPIFLYFHRYNG